MRSYNIKPTTAHTQYTSHGSVTLLVKNNCMLNSKTKIFRNSRPIFEKLGLFYANFKLVNSQES